MAETVKAYFNKQKAHRMIWAHQAFIDETDAIKIADQYTRKIQEERMEIVKWIIKNRYNRKINNKVMYEMLKSKLEVLE